MSFALKHSLLAAAACLVIGASPLAVAAEDHWHHEFHEHEFGRFGPRDREVWTGGHWHHEWHNGRFGWWWFAGGIWYFYDEPVYPYPTVISTVTYPEPAAAPPPPAVPAATPTYYYCDNPAGYYPYVPNCPTPWRAVPATPQPPAPAAPPPNAPPPPR